MSKVLIIAELDGHALNPSTAKCVTCAAALPDASIDVLILSDQTGDAAAAAAQIDGVAKVLTIEAGHNAHPLAAVLAPQIAAAAADYADACQTAWTQFAVRHLV